MDTYTSCKSLSLYYNFFRHSRVMISMKLFVSISTQSITTVIILTHHYEAFVGDGCPLGQQSWLVSKVDTSRGDHCVAELANLSLPSSNIQFLAICTINDRCYYLYASYLSRHSLHLYLMPVAVGFLFRFQKPI